MRSDLKEPSLGRAPSKTASCRRDERVCAQTVALDPTFVDAALGDEALPVAGGAARAPIEAPDDRASRYRRDAVGLLEQLSRQLHILEIQQKQIRRLLDGAHSPLSQAAD